MQTAPTPLDHMCAIVSLDILEMDKIAQVKLIHIRGVHVYVDCSIELTASNSLIEMFHQRTT